MMAPGGLQTEVYLVIGKGYAVSMHDDLRLGNCSSKCLSS